MDSFGFIFLIIVLIFFFFVKFAIGIFVHLSELHVIYRVNGMKWNKIEEDLKGYVLKISTSSFTVY